MNKIFIDMDGVIVDFDLYMQVNKMTVDQVKTTPGTFLKMPPFPQAIESVKKIISNGLYDVWIASKPPTGIPTAASDKVAWILQHLPELKRKIILTPNKGILGDSGDILIDDMIYNANCQSFLGRIIEFKNWKDTLKQLQI